MTKSTVRLCNYLFIVRDVHPRWYPYLTLQDGHSTPTEANPVRSAYVWVEPDAGEGVHCPVKTYKWVRLIGFLEKAEDAVVEGHGGRGCL
jgi:hypothetical protein